MRRMLAALGSIAAIVIGLTVGLPSSAQADGDCNFGNFCAYADDGGGYLYQTAGNSVSWPGEVKNKVDWVMNNGSSSANSHRVDTFYATEVQGYGAYACIDLGTAWDLRGGGYIFSWSGHHGSSGLNQNVHDNAAAHHWVRGACENNNDTWSL